MLPSDEQTCTETHKEANHTSTDLAVVTAMETGHTLPYPAAIALHRLSKLQVGR